MQYLLKLSIALTVVYLFYLLLLRRLTFYNWNRWYLLAYSMLCLFIPLIDVVGLLQQRGWQDAAIVSYIPVITAANGVEAEAGIDWWKVLILVMATGSVLMLGRLLIQFLSLKRLQSSAVLLSDGDVKLYHVDQKIIPFSTHSAIYINRHLHAEDELKEIIHHEFVHVKQRHSFDLWWSEILCILNWYNPFAWLIRKAMRQNLEFIADHQVLQSGLDRKQYQYLLLKVTGIAPFSIAPKFNFSSLKKRIVMMNKSKSANINVTRFLFILPLLVVVLLAFRSVATVNNNYPEKKNIIDTIPSASKKITGTVIITKEDLLKQKGVREIRVKTKDNESTARVTLTDGTVKTFNLNDPKEQEAFEREYGDLTPPTPPTPVTPAHAPRSVAAPARVTPVKPVAPAAAPDEVDVAAPVAIPAAPAIPRAPKAAPAPPKKVDVQIRGTATITHEVPATVTGNAKTGTGEVTMVMTEAPVVVQSKNVDIVATGTVTVDPAEVVEVRKVSPVTTAHNVTTTPAKPAGATGTGEVIEVRTVQPIKLQLKPAQPKTSN
jgi:hypothetical protein